MIIALHGFLGLPSDWNTLSSDLGDVHAYNLWNDLKALPENRENFSTWVEMFVTRIRALSEGKAVSLIGYSMGGRLAMHALVRAPELFKSAVIVSSNPGLQKAADKEERLEIDKSWSMRFILEPWISLMEDWGAQPVFQKVTPAEGSIELDRSEDMFDRDLLAMALDSWSLGRQDDLRPALEKLQTPVMFMTGSEDQKFTNIVKGLSLNPRQTHAVIEGAGHRVPWDRPKTFSDKALRFLNTP